MTSVSHFTPPLSSSPTHLAEITIGLGRAGGPMLAGPGLAWIHLVLTRVALESRGAVTEIGGAAVNTEASILAQGRDFYAWGERQTGMDKAKWGRRVLRGPRHRAERPLGATGIPGVGGGLEQSVLPDIEEVKTSSRPLTPPHPHSTGMEGDASGLSEQYKQLCSLLRTRLKKASKGNPGAGVFPNQA